MLNGNPLFNIDARLQFFWMTGIGRGRTWTRSGVDGEPIDVIAHDTELHGIVNHLHFVGVAHIDIVVTYTALILHHFTEVTLSGIGSICIGIKLILEVKTLAFVNGRSVEYNQTG